MKTCRRSLKDGLYENGKQYQDKKNLWKVIKSDENNVNGETIKN